ncbi:MAG: transposase family protein [Desulfobacter sp.]|nr:transposase family protein [Desulfobacter sp.]WDP84422.1 MAG: transposase family protein [Desulfobacter sp.]
MNEKKSLETFFDNIQDPRHHNKLHNLIDVVIIAICAVVAGADTYEQIENFGKKKKVVVKISKPSPWDTLP